MKVQILKTSSFLKKQYCELDFGGVWKDSFGSPERNSRWLIYGKSGEGKTEFSVQLAKYLSGFGKVLYVSREQGPSSSLQQCFARNAMKEVGNKVLLGVDMDFKTLLTVLKKRTKHAAIIIDSIDYMRLTAEEYKVLDQLCKKTVLVFVSWSDNRRPKSSAGKDIEYMCDVKIYVDRYVVLPRSRYGGNAPYVIWEDGAKRHHGWMNR